MNIDKFYKLGWVAAAAIAGVLLAGGFQDATTKFGVVDIAQVVDKSDFGVSNQATFTQMKKDREGLLEFIDNQRVLTTEQAQDMKDLTLKTAKTPEDTTKLERIKADVTASNKKWVELSQKSNLTPEDRTLLDEYAKRGQTMEQLARRWYQDFTNEMQSWADKQKMAGLDKARAAVQDVAKAQGFTIVFDAGVAPYCANDITDAALKAMNAKK